MSRNEELCFTQTIDAYNHFGFIIYSSEKSGIKKVPSFSIAESGSYEDNRVRINTRMPHLFIMSSIIHSNSLPNLHALMFIKIQTVEHNRQMCVKRGVLYHNIFRTRIQTAWSSTQPNTTGNHGVCYLLRKISMGTVSTPIWTSYSFIFSQTPKNERWEYR